MIEIRQLNKSFRILGREKKVLSGINLTFPDAGLICICGKSGSGKSTLLNILGIQDKADSGEVLYNGENILKYSESKRNAYRRTVTGRISQDYDLIPELTVYDNCELAVGLSSEEKSRANLIAHCLDSVGLSDYEKRKVWELSGGEKQRVAIARALAGNVSVLLCDEPTGNLDPDSSKEVMDRLKTVSEKVCVIVVTHNRSLAEKYADRIIDIGDGHITSDRIIIKDKEPAEIAEKNANLSNKKKPVPGKYIFRFALLNAGAHKIITAAIALLLAFLMALLLTSSYMASYSRAGAIAANLESQKMYSVIVTNFLQSLSNGEPLVEAPYSFYFTDEMKAELAERCPDLTFGDVYSFGRNFYDFSDAENLENGFYHSISFTDFIVVNDFEEFSYELEAGTYPQISGDVVIFDYMAENLLYFSVFDDVKTYEDLIGYTLTDNLSGFSMTISGILKSNFKDFEYVGDAYDHFGRDSDYYVANACLAKYRCVFGGTEFTEKLKSGSRYASYEEAEYTFSQYVNAETQETTLKKKNIVKVGVTSAEEAASLSIDIIYSSGSGYLIRDTLLAEMLGISVDEIDADFCEKLFSDEYKDITVDLYNTTYSHYEANYFSYFFSSTFGLSGTYHSNSENNIDVLEIEDNDERLIKEAGIYSGPELLLSSDTEENTRRIAELLPVLHDLSFWDGDAEKTETGYMIYSYFDSILTDLDEYLQVNNRLFKQYSWLVALFMAAAVFTYTVVSIRKNERTIGILRSVGLSRAGVMAIYASSSMAITLIAFLLSVAGAQFLLYRANEILSEGFGISLTVYTFSATAVAEAFVIVISAAAVAFICVYMWLIIRKPISLIYGRRD